MKTGTFIDIEKASATIDLMLSVISTSDIAQAENAPCPIDNAFDVKDMFCRLLQPEKALFPILDTLAGKWMLRIDLHPWKA